MDTSEIIRAVQGVEIVTGKPVNLGKAALWYVEKWNWPLFPVKPRGKTPLTARGLHDASRDVKQVSAWWKHWPDANIATPTGATGCGYDVIDLDGDKGAASWERIDAGHRPTPLAVVFTPGSPSTDKAPGRHLYIAAQGQRNTANLLPGVDVRGDGGYVCLPPSVALHGVSYAWIERPAGLT